MTVSSSTFRGRTAWATAVYQQSDLTLPPVGKPDFLLTSKRLLRGPCHVHTYADPFLFG